MQAGRPAKEQGIQPDEMPGDVRDVNARATRALGRDLAGINISRRGYLGSKAI